MPFDWESAADHCRFSHLRGRFLAGGSLSLAGGRTHLEFVVPAADAARLGLRLRGIGLPASVRLRRGAGVVTWKSADTVATFLRRAGAPAGALELEAQLVGRSFRGELNRAINAEHANLRRQVSAAARQLEAIDRLRASGRLARLPELERSVAAARREAPEATFAELAARLGMTRSLVQRALGRLESADLHDDGGGPRTGFGSASG
jgi:DNA-binding protein WhiA